MSADISLLHDRAIVHNFKNGRQAKGDFWVSQNIFIQDPGMSPWTDLHKEEPASGDDRYLLFCDTAIRACRNWTHNINLTFDHAMLFTG